MIFIIKIPRRERESARESERESKRVGVGKEEEGRGGRAD